MASEAILIREMEVPIPMTCAVGTGIPKGTVLALTDGGANGPTVAACTADNDTFGGIAAAEKIADDGQTQIPVFMKGIFAMVIAGGDTTTVGHQVTIQGANLIGEITTNDNELGYVIGKALETGTAAETVLVFVGGH